MNIPKRIEVENLDHLGIIAGIIDELRIPEIVSERLGIEAQEKINSGQIVKAIILNGLGFVSKPLYLFPQFFRNKAVEKLLGEGIKVEHINDDKIGRVMDKLFCHGLSEIFVEIVLNTIKKYQISTKQAHLDASSMCLSGQYQNQSGRLEINQELEPSPQPIQIVKGYSRDHRPDLKQFVILAKYKEQQCTERGFRFLKDPLFFADSVFLKSPERIETMAMLI